MTDHPLWAFSLRIYAAPGVAQACLALQDEAGADVNLLLYLLWCATTNRALDAASIAKADAAIKVWRQTVIGPLRAMRRTMKRELLAGIETEDFRERVKALELEAERLAQMALFALAPHPSGAAGPAAAGHALSLYAAQLGTKFSPAHLERLYAATGFGPNQEAL